MNLLVLSVIGTPEDVAIEKLRKHVGDGGVRMTLVRKLNEAERWDESIATLREGKAQKSMESRDCALEILDVLRNHGSKEEYIAELKEFVLTRPSFDFSNETMAKKAVELKDVLSDGEWKGVYEEIKKRKESWVKMLFFSIGDYAELMDTLESEFKHRQSWGSMFYYGSDGIRYLNALKDTFPERVVAYQEKDAKSKMDGMCGRAGYADFASALKVLSWNKEGKKKARALADKAKGEHPKWPALPDELRKAGF